MLATRENFDSCLAEIHGSPAFVDCETTGLLPYGRQGHPADRVCGVAVRIRGKSFYFPVRHSGGQNLESGQYARLIERLRIIPEIRNHNTKFDILALSQDGFTLPAKIACTFGGSHLYNENESHRLKGLADKYLGGGSEEAQNLDALLLARGLSKSEMWRMDPGWVAPYAEKDTELAESLDSWLRSSLYRPSLYDEVSEFIRVLAQMEMWGVKISRSILLERREEAQREAGTLLSAIHRAAGYPLNPNSPSHVKHWLRTRDATEETLLGSTHPGAALILKYKAWMKAITSYYNCYLGWMDSSDVIHASMNPGGTISGRISMSDPNLQAIARWSEEQKVKDVFEARPGFLLAELDYSQAEIRVMAHYTGEEKLLEMFRSNVADLHAAVSKQLGVPRQVGKQINLSVVYGAGAESLAIKLNLKKSEAQDFLNKYHNEYPAIKRLTRAAEKAAETRGYIELWTGRRRHFNTRETETRKAFANLIQGSTAEMVRKVMVRVFNEIPHSDCRMLLQEHDALLLEVREDICYEVLEEVRAIMEHQPQFRAPMKVDAKMGRTLGTMEKINADL